VKSDKLETLSIEALYALADRMGLDLPAGLERPFVMEEIVDALEEDSEDRRAAHGEAVHVDEKKYAGAGFDDFEIEAEGGLALEARYNETMVRALVRDPSWAFAYWDISDADRAALRCVDGSMSLFLRVTELSDQDEGRREFFDIPIADDDQQWYINLPRPGVRFRIDLCSRSQPGGKHKVLSRSNELRSPRQMLSVSDCDGDIVRLLRLSGIDGSLFECEGETRGSRRLTDDASEGRE
jgi:hypothetical protein